jgi:hypothetical protein
VDPAAPEFLAAVRRAYPDVEPLVMTTKVEWADGGPDPLDGLAFFPVETPVPHWHAVGYGLSAPGERRAHDFELSVRVARDADEDEPPGWVFSWLQNQAEYVVTSGRPLRPGDQMDANSPIRDGSDTELTAMLYRADPVFDPCVEADVVQVVAITRDELRAKRAWQSEALLELLERSLGPELIVDLSRASVLADPAVARAAEEGARRDGSSTASIAVERLAVRPPRVAIDALTAEDLGLMVAARLGHGRDLELRDAADRVVHLVAGDEVLLEETGGGHWKLTLPPAAVGWLDASLPARAGVYAPPELAPVELEVEAIDVTDRSGAVVERLG